MRISNENTDKSAEMNNKLNPNINPHRDIAKGSDNAPPPIIVDMRLNIPTLALCRRDFLSNADGVMHSGDLTMDVGGVILSWFDMLFQKT